MTGIIFNIERFAVHDGPGIRTLVFLKGCPLRCLWCQNPEGWYEKPDLLFHIDKCISCGKCIENCPEDALLATRDGIVRNKNKCKLCFSCLNVCPTGAWEKCGSIMDSSEVVDIVLQDAIFYSESGGGITLTGGDPLMQADFSAEILRESKAHYLHTAVETCLAFNTDVLEKIIPYTDLFLCDIKHMDNSIHKELTQSGNIRILENIRYLDENNKKTIIRVPLIPGLNDSKENLMQTAEFIKTLKNINEVQLLGYNNLCLTKYPLVGVECGVDFVEHYSEDKLKLAEDFFRNREIIVSSANS